MLSGNNDSSNQETFMSIEQKSLPLSIRRALVGLAKLIPLAEVTDGYCRLHEGIRRKAKKLRAKKSEEKVRAVRTLNNVSE